MGEHEGKCAVLGEAWEGVAGGAQVKGPKVQGK